MQNLHLYYTISVSVLMLSTLVSGLELLFTPKRYVNFVYPNTITDHKHAKWRAVLSAQVVLVLITFAALLFGGPNLFKIPFLILTATNLYVYRIRTIGKDGADQVRLLGLLSFSLCFLIGGDNGLIIPMYFMAIQILIGYTTSGLIKLRSPYWRQGNVLAGILATYAFGIPKVATLLVKNPLLERALSYGAIFSMMAVLVTFVLPFQWLLITSLVMIFTFHCATALLMGLNDFVITFPMAYPGILLLHAQLFHLPV